LYKRKANEGDGVGRVLGYTIIVTEDYTKNTEGDAFLPGWRDVQKFSVWPPYQVSHKDFHVVSGGFILDLDSTFFNIKYSGTSVADPDPGSGAFLTLDPGRNRFLPDPGCQTNIFDGFMTVFGVKSTKFLVFWPKKFRNLFKNKTIHNF
jgi:hypothetical protein